MVGGPPLFWSVILSLDPVAMGLRGPAVIYSLVALAFLPGIVGLRMLPWRRSTKWLILPLYLVGMAFVMLNLLLIIVCVATHDCP